MKQNVDLIKQINDLKQELHIHKKNIKLIQSASQIQEQAAWAQATQEERDLKQQDITIGQLTQQLQEEQYRNQQLKERKPHRLAPLVQRDGSQDDVQKQPSQDMMDYMEVSDDMQQIQANDGVPVDNATDDQNEQ